MTAGDLVALMLLRDGLGGKVDHVLVLKDDEVQVLDDQWVRGGLGAAEHDEIVDLAVKILLAGGRPLRVHFAVSRLDVTPLHPAVRAAVGRSLAAAPMRRREPDPALDRARKAAQPLHRCGLPCSTGNQGALDWDSRGRLQRHAVRVWPGTCQGMLLRL